MIDLRSDTVTRPTEAMRRAMAAAEVGDDVYGDDPTVNRLEEEAARLVGHEAALFVPSGTMGNQLAVMTHTRRGDEVILDGECHIVVHEVGAAAVLSGVSLRTLVSKNGRMDISDVYDASRDPEDIHAPRSRLLCLENAHGGGDVLPLSYMQEMRAAASDLGLFVHLDGARLFNASAVLGCAPADIAACADSVMFCLSKGLAAPVGSLLCGKREFVETARKNRKLLGGGMRQAGILAAAGLVALEGRGRLPEDHRTARILYEGLAALPGFAVKEPRINMVFFRLPKAMRPGRDFYEGLLDAGILTNPPSPGGEMRVVTHYEVSEPDVYRVLDAVRRLAG